MKLAQYILQRFVTYLAVLFIGITITFFLPRLMPGDPINNYISQVQARAGQTMTPAATQELRDSLAELYGLKHLGILNGVTFTGHQIGSSLSIQLGGLLRDLTGSYDWPFAIAGLLLFAASLVSLAIDEKRYSARYQTRPEPPLSYAG